jgi:hypothetical protein
MNKPAIIEAIMSDIGRAARMPSTRVETKRFYDKHINDYVKQYVPASLQSGPEGIYDQFRTKVVDDANASAKAIRNMQIGLGAEDNANAIVNKDADGMMGIAQLLGMNTNVSNKILGNLNPAARQDVAIKAAEKGLADNSLRGIRRRGAEWVAANPDTAIPVGLSAAGAGGAALLTASGQALAALTNNMTQALKTEDNRDNVLTS